jgi:hypothetical protein
MLWSYQLGMLIPGEWQLTLRLKGRGGLNAESTIIICSLQSSGVDHWAHHLHTSYYRRHVDPFIAPLKLQCSYPASGGGVPLYCNHGITRYSKEGSQQIIMCCCGGGCRRSSLEFRSYWGFGGMTPEVNTKQQTSDKSIAEHLLSRI